MARKEAYAQELPGENTHAGRGEDVEEMITLFQVNGIMLYVDPDEDEDVFSNIRHVSQALQGVWPRRWRCRVVHSLSRCITGVELNVCAFHRVIAIHQLDAESLGLSAFTISASLAASRLKASRQACL